MLPMDKIPVVSPRTMLKEALEIMGQFRLGIVCITSSSGKLEGIFTDGDVRRMLLKQQKPFAALFSDDVIVHAIKNCTTVTPETLLVKAVEIMGKKQIWDLPVVDESGLLRGLLHLHPAVEMLLSL